MGAGQRRRGAILSIQSRIGAGQRRRGCQFKAKIDKKLVFSWLLPDVLTGWPILPKYSLINH